MNRFVLSKMKWIFLLKACSNVGNGFVILQQAEKHHC